jgi:hypothetical protein
MVPLSSEERAALLAALEAYDTKQFTNHIRNPKKRYYNIHALPLYKEALERASNAINCGTTRREALLESYTGKLLDIMLKVLKMDKSTDAEQRCNF